MKLNNRNRTLLGEISKNIGVGGDASHGDVGSMVGGLGDYANGDKAGIPTGGKKKQLRASYDALIGGGDPGSARGMSNNDILQAILAKTQAAAGAGAVPPVQAGGGDVMQPQPITPGVGTSPGQAVGISPPPVAPVGPPVNIGQQAVPPGTLGQQMPSGGPVSSLIGGLFGGSTSPGYGMNAQPQPVPPSTPPMAGYPGNPVQQAGPPTMIPQPAKTTITPPNSQSLVNRIIGPGMINGR